MDLKKLANQIADRVGEHYASKLEDKDPRYVIRDAVLDAIYQYESAQTRDWAINGRW